MKILRGLPDAAFTFRGTIGIDRDMSFSTRRGDATSFELIREVMAEKEVLTNRLAFIQDWLVRALDTGVWPMSESVPSKGPK